MSKKSLQELARVHLALIGILDSNVISGVTRRQIELLCEEIEREIAELYPDPKDQGTSSMAAD